MISIKCVVFLLIVLLCDFLQEGCVYAVEFSHRSGRDLVNMAKKRTNVIPIIEDARHPAKYRMLVGMVDVIFSDVAQPDQVCFSISSYKMNAQSWFFTLQRFNCDLIFKNCVLMIANDDHYLDSPSDHYG